MHDRLPSLTGLRFAAAFAVFGFHVHAQGFLDGGPLERVLEWVFAGGSTGVGFFFVLSGFVLTWSARPGENATAIWRRRTTRIVPSHVVAWLVAFAGLVYAGKTVSAWAAPSLALMQAWVPIEQAYFAVNTPSWSLSCELAFYLAFPLLLPVIHRMGVRWLWPVTILLIAGVISVPLVGLALPDQVAYWFIWVCPATRALEFVVGMVLARIVREDRWIGLGLWPATGLVIAGYLASTHLPAGFGFVAATVIPFALLIPAAATADLRGTRTPWRSATFVLLGEWSFAFYLLHQIVIRGIDTALGDRSWGVAPGLLIIGVMLTVSLSLSYLLHRGVERPMVRLLAARPRMRPVLRPAELSP